MSSDHPEIHRPNAVDGNDSEHHDYGLDLVGEHRACPVDPATRRQFMACVGVAFAGALIGSCSRGSKNSDRESIRLYGQDARNTALVYAKKRAAELSNDPADVEEIANYAFDAFDVEYGHRQRHGTDGLTQESIENIIDVWLRHGVPKRDETESSEIIQK